MRGVEMVLGSDSVLTRTTLKGKRWLPCTPRKDDLYKVMGPDIGCRTKLDVETRWGLREEMYYASKHHKIFGFQMPVPALPTLNSKWSLG